MVWVYVYGPFVCQGLPCELPDYCQVPLNYSISMHTAALNYITICMNWYFLSNRFKCSGGISDSFGVCCSNRARNI